MRKTRPKDCKARKTVTTPNRWSAKWSVSSQNIQSLLGTAPRNLVLRLMVKLVKAKTAVKMKEKKRLPQERSESEGEMDSLGVWRVL